MTHYNSSNQAVYLDSPRHIEDHEQIVLDAVLRWHDSFYDATTQGELMSAARAYSNHLGVLEARRLRNGQ